MSPRSRWLSQACPKSHDLGREVELCPASLRESFLLWKRFLGGGGSRLITYKMETFLMRQLGGRCELNPLIPGHFFFKWWISEQTRHFFILKISTLQLGNPWIATVPMSCSQSPRMKYWVLWRRIFQRKWKFSTLWVKINHIAFCIIWF